MTVPSPEPTDPDVDAAGPVVRDKRRIDPATGQVRVHDGPPVTKPADGPAEPAVAALEEQLAERTSDLQRLQAEFANYRKRVERDRQAVADQALASVIVGLLPVLDDIERAREHGEVEGGFKSVADNLETTLTKLGLVRFGAPGEAFDPTVHEAITHGFSSDVTQPTAAKVLQPGFRLGDRVLRPARVAVVEPGDATSDADT